MSIKVDQDALAETIARFDSAYLLSTRGVDVKAVAVDVTVSDGALRVPWSKGSAANIGANAAVTLLFPPTEHHGYSLIVDGTGRDAGDSIEVSPTSAILHRPAAHSDGPLPPDGCTDDCRRV
ncbi:MAG TPA: pyridoxamine 5'-phosphate oxidase [Flexivirga sp.]|uniref:pyridoxamine 5'-phosphate oxidase n=1 Tax=Flexivirga sp. TaxID=1962927 RepID=UPI002B917C2F|nr:pyridoxamine 5'-phosphate oxidase [Flexivirga sp.]HWC23282.1 pyridoxamine 5'-phosphate oxidase [Flexivirga sp.]